MDQCLKGKVDMVITKSISRFARNTVDCISWVRKLRKNVAVYFEKENLNTLDDSTEMILTILSSQAQEAVLSAPTSSGGMRESLKRGIHKTEKLWIQEGANRRDVHRGGGSGCYPKHGPVVSGRGQPGTNQAQTGGRRDRDNYR